MTGTWSRLFSCLLFLLLLLDLELPIKASDDVEDPESSCADNFLRRRERLDNFNFTFTDSRQLGLFKYLSARSFGRAVPTSVVRTGLDNVPHINKILRQLTSEEDLGRKIMECEKRQLFNKRSNENCYGKALRMKSEYLERLQKLRDMHIDCWKSEGYNYFFNDIATPISQNFLFLQWLSSMGSKSTPWKTCNEIFSDESNFTDFSASLSPTYSRVVDDCDYQEWRNLSRYEFICRPSPAVPINTHRESDAWHRIGSKMSSLLDLPSEQLRPEHRFSIDRTKSLFNSGQYFKSFSRSAEESSAGLWKSSQGFTRPQLLDGYEVITYTTLKLIRNETIDTKARALDLLDRYFIEEINMQYNSEPRLHHKGIFYIFNKKCENLTLLQLTKILGSNYPFKYVHVHDDLAYEVNMDNDLVFGQFVADPDLGTHPIIERLRWLLNDFIRFYWDIMSSRGVHPQQPTADDYAVICSYRRLSEFRKFDHTAEMIAEDREDRAELRNMLHEKSAQFQRISYAMYCLIAQCGIPDDMCMTTSDEYAKVVDLAYDTFKKTNRTLRAEAAAAVEDLFTQIWSFEEEPGIIFAPEFMLNKTFVTECRNETGCEFLMALQMLGSTYELKYLDGDGAEVFIDGTGVFTYIPREKEETEEIARFRRILNHLADLVLTAKKQR